MTGSIVMAMWSEGLEILWILQGRAVSTESICSQWGGSSRAQQDHGYGDGWYVYCIQCCQHWPAAWEVIFNFSREAEQWMWSYLTEKPQCITISGSTSSILPHRMQQPSFLRSHWWQRRGAIWNDVKQVSENVAVPDTEPAVYIYWQDPYHDYVHKTMV